MSTHETIKAAWLRLRDDGSRPCKEIAEALGCTADWVWKLRRQMQQGKIEPLPAADAPRCSRCEFVEDEKRPIVTPALERRLVEVLGGHPRPVQPGLCLWCWLAEQRLDYQRFYTSGAWEAVVDWEPPRDPLLALRARVQAAMQERHATPLGLGEATGIDMRQVLSFLNDGRRLTWDREILEALCSYAGVEVADYEKLLAR